MAHITIIGPRKKVTKALGDQQISEIGFDPYRPPGYGVVVEVLDAPRTFTESLTKDLGLEARLHQTVEEARSDLISTLGLDEE